MVRRKGTSLGVALFDVGLSQAAGAAAQEGAGRNGGSKGTFPGAGALSRNPPKKEANWRFTMKMVKSLLLGSAAGLVAVAGAQAADLPVKAKPVEYVKVCSLY